MSETMNDPEAGTEVHPFDLGDLPNILDRVTTPVTLDLGDDIITVTSAYADRWGVHVVLTDDRTMSLDRGVMASFVGPVTVLGAPAEVKAYVTRDGEILCADHGARFDLGVTDGDVHPVFDGSDLDAVEYCSHCWAPGDRGHSFCGSCGTDIEPKGHPDSGFVGDLFSCDNCREKAVYVDGEGYVHVDGLESITEAHNVEVKASAVHRALDGELSITTVVDGTPYRFTETKGFVCYLDDDPSAGRLLVLDSCWDGANEEAEGFFDDTLQRVVAEVIEAEALDVNTAEGAEAVEAVEADFRASLQVVRVDLGAVTFHPKR